MKFNLTPKITYRNGFILLTILVGLTMTFLSFDYGPLEDAKVHQDHGVRILNYFKGLDKIATLSPVDDQGKYFDVNKDLQSEHHGMNGFGGFFDLLSNFLYQYFDATGVYEFRNFLNSIFGFLLFLFCGLLGKELGGWKAGMMTLVFVALMPLLFGHSMNNPKDIPAAAFYMFSVFHIVKLLKELPEITLKRSIFLIINISLLINIRIMGLMVLGYVLLVVFIWWFVDNYKSKFKKVALSDTLMLAGKTIGICILSYLAVSIFWPYAHTNPIKVPIEVLTKMGEFRGFENLQMFEGSWQSSFNLPWYYAIKNLFIITMPLHAFIGFFLIPLLYYKSDKENMFYISFVLFASIFPMLLVVIGKPNNYDNSRQFLFSVLPIVILSALSWNVLFQFITMHNVKKLVYLALILFLLQPLRFMVRHHPLQSLYYGPLVKGVIGAYGNYEIDYYGVAIKPALDWLDENVGDENNPPKVRMYYGSQTKITYYLDKSKSLKHALVRRNSPDWDYAIIMLAEGKYKQSLNVNWSPKNTVHEVKIDKIPICYIVKNDYQNITYITRLEEELAISPSADKYIELSLMHYKNGNYFESVKASNNAILLDQKNSIAYNNLCSAYNNLLMYDEAKIACEKSLEIEPSALLTKNNLKASLKGVDKRINNEFTVKEYVALSYNYYRLGHYNKCITVSEKLLEVDSNSTTAYNNICSSYNSLGEYERAIEACKKAIEIDSNFQLAKNNLRWAKKQLEVKKTRL